MSDDTILAEALAGVRAALGANPPRSRWAQLASVDESGAARVRTLVLHEVTDDATLVFATDAASGKVAQLGAHPRGEVCLVSHERLEQWRLLARFEKARDDERRHIWRALTPKERSYYTNPPPGLERARFPESAFKAEAHGDEPAARFVVLVGRVEKIDRLDVSITPHRRFLFERGAPWRRTELTP
jgi:hypothetical protein